MFSKIPQRLTAPFGLLGDEAKLAFPSQPGGILKLATTRDIPETDSYWDQYFVLFDTASEVFTLITPHHLRRALSEAPENVATLIRVVTKRLLMLISNHSFPSSSNGAVTTFASNLMKTATGSSERQPTKEVLNCLRILQRVLPVVFELEGESNVFEAELLWKKEEVDEEDEVNELASEAAQFVIDDDEDSEGETEESAEPEQVTAEDSTPTPKPKKQLPSLGERLFSAIIDLMFCCGFTLPTKLQVDHYKIQYVIWEKGVGSTVDPGPSQAYENNKTEVLRLLLILLSRQIYVSPSSLFTKPSLYTLHFVQNTTRRDVLTVLCSLLNTAINSTTVTDTSIQAMAGKLPYNHLVFKGEDSRSILVGTCFQLLCVLLDFQSGTARDSATGSGEQQNYAPTMKTNSFRYFLMKLHRVQDFEFILNGIMAIFEQQLATVNNLLPGARKSVPYMMETIIFLWRMLDLSKKFRTFVLDSDKCMDLVASLLCYALEIKDKPQQHGLCRALSYIVQTLSAEPAFGTKLMKPIKVQLPAKWTAPGTAADFMINAIYAIVATTSGQLNSLYPALIIALSNSAPYFKNLTVTACTRLAQLFTSFSNPLFLLSDEGHPRLLFFMLEIFNSVLLYNLSENPNLVYGVLQSHKTFEDLGTFTLARGLRDIRRVQLAKEEQARRSEGNAKGKAVGNQEEQLEPGDEKARLLEREQGRARSPPQEETESEPQEADSAPPEIPTSPTSDSPTGVSEKARGKMRERRSMSTDTTSSLDRVAATGVGRNGFVPTQEWVTSWQQGLPLDAVMLTISELMPKVQELQASRHKATSASAIVDFLSTASLQQVLPTPPPLTPRRFMWSDASIVWLTSLIWGEIYVKGMTPLGIWNATNVRLFYVKHTQIQQRQLTETVSNVVGFLRRNTQSENARG